MGFFFNLTRTFKNGPEGKRVPLRRVFLFSFYFVDFADYSNFESLHLNFCENSFLNSSKSKLL